MRYLYTTKWVSLICIAILATLILTLHFCVDLPFSDLLAVASLFIVFVIAIIQQIHLNRLEKIGILTVDIAEKLRIDARLEQNIQDFFGIFRGDKKRYQCVFPIEFREKPSPFINAGDYHALEVLTSQLKADRLELNPFQRGEMAGIKGDNLVFICAPAANPITETIFNSKDDMPCWITGEGTNTRIRIKDEDALLESPWEPYYAEAANPQLTSSDHYRNFMGRKSCEDYGILARLHDGEKRYILIAGLHQPGTWIVAEFLNELLKKQRNEVDSVFFQPCDFAMVIWGRFEGKTFTVDPNKGIFKDYWWQREGDSWVKVKASLI